MLPRSCAMHVPAILAIALPLHGVNMLASTSMLAYVPVTRANNGDLLLLSCHDSSSLVKAERGSGEEVSNVHCQARSKRVKLVGDSGLRCGSAGYLPESEEIKMRAARLVSNSARRNRNGSDQLTRGICLRKLQHEAENGRDLRKPQAPSRWAIKNEMHGLGLCSVPRRCTAPLSSTDQ